jgi:hypothetical protein
MGGVGLVLCAVLGMMQNSLLSVGLFVGVSFDIAFAAAVLLFAIGLSREGSAVARDRSA